MIFELEELSNDLQDTNTHCTLKKKKMEAFISKLTKEEESNE